MKKLHLLSLSALVMISGCSTSKTHSWVSPDFQERSIGKTVVVATFDDPYLSLEFEAVFAQHLRDYVPAVSMRADVKNIEHLDKEQIENLLKENKVKTLAVTHRVGSVNRSQLVPYGVSYQTYATTDGSYYTYCSSYQLDETVDSFTENAIETTLFDVDSGTLIWSGLRKVYDFNSKLSNMKAVVNEIIWDLEENGMIKAAMVY